NDNYVKVSYFNPFLEDEIVHASSIFRAIGWDITLLSSITKIQKDKSIKQKMQQKLDSLQKILDKKNINHNSSKRKNSLSINKSVNSLLGDSKNPIKKSKKEINYSQDIRSSEEYNTESDWNFIFTCVDSLNQHSVDSLNQHSVD